MHVFSLVDVMCENVPKWRTFFLNTPIKDSYELKTRHEFNDKTVFEPTICQMKFCVLHLVPQIN